MPVLTLEILLGIWVVLFARVLACKKGDQSEHVVFKVSRRHHLQTIGLGYQ